MLKDNFVTVEYKLYASVPNQIKEYVEKHFGTKFKKGVPYQIPVYLLQPGSNIEITAICDYCGEENSVQYRTYTNSLKNGNSNTYCCKACMEKKRKREAEIKFNSGLLNKDAINYYSFEENRLKELELWLEQNAGKVSIYTSDIYSVLKRYMDNDTLWKTIVSLGYDEEFVRLRKKDNWWSNEDNVKLFLTECIEKNSGIFPTTYELLSIMPKYVYENYGYLPGLKKLVGYIDHNTILDTLGNQYKSNYEAIVANFLICCNIQFLSDKTIVPEANYRYDLEILNNKIVTDKQLMVEIWGYRVDDKFAVSYNETRKIKESLYKSHSHTITLISITQETFKGNYSRIAKNLIDIFSEHIDLPEIDVKTIDLAPRGKDYLTEEKILEICKMLSSDGITMPSHQEFIKLNYTVYYKIIQNYETLYNFAQKFNMISTHTPKNHWSKINLFKGFDEMKEITGRYITNSHEIRNTPEYAQFARLIDASYRNGNGGWKKCWKEYFESKNIRGLMN